MVAIKKTDYFNISTFTISFLIGSKEKNELLDDHIDGIEFLYKKRNLFSFNRNKLIIDIFYYMNKNYSIIKEELEINKNFITNKDIVIKSLSVDDKKHIELYRLKIVKFLKMEIFPNKLSYSGNGRLFYKIRLECVEI